MRRVESESKIETDPRRNPSQSQIETIISQAKCALNADKASPSRGTAPAAPHTQRDRDGQSGAWHSFSCRWTIGKSISPELYPQRGQKLSRERTREKEKERERKGGKREGEKRESGAECGAATLIFDWTHIITVKVHPLHRVVACTLPYTARNVGASLSRAEAQLGFGLAIEGDEQSRSIGHKNCVACSRIVSVVQRASNATDEKQ